jgi:ABC-2 type transport system permease protein
MTAPAVQAAAVPDAPLTPPGATGGLLEVFRRRYLLRLLVRKEIQARYQGSLLGLLWSYVQPIVRFTMYFFVMGIVLKMHRSVDNFAIHLFAAMAFVHYFTETFSAGTRSIVQNRALVRKMAMPREMFPVASMVVSAIHTFPQVLLLAFGALATGWTFDVYGVLAGLLGLAIITVFGMALALLFSAANVFFRDFGSFVAVLGTFITFSVPMIYPYSLVDDRFGRFAEFYLLNPLAVCVLLSQRCFWVGATSNPAATIRTNMPPNLLEIGLLQLAGSLVLLIVAQLVFSKMENRFAERL